MNYVKMLLFLFFVVGIISFLIDFINCIKEDVSFVNKVVVNKICKMVRNKQVFGNYKFFLCNMYLMRLLGFFWYY